MANTNVLITGASRGIGKELARLYLARPSTTVIAAVRNPLTATSLSSLPVGPSSTLIIIKLDSASENDPLTAIKLLQTSHAITSLDIVIANAGISDAFYPVSSVSVPTLHLHWETNSLAPILLFQAALPLMGNNAKFVVMSSALASLGAMGEWPNTFAYGASKAYVNHFMRRVHFENQGLVAFALDPGFVQTDMGNTGAKKVGMEEATTPTDVCCEGMVKVIDEATREETSGKFKVWNSEVDTLW